MGCMIFWTGNAHVSGNPRRQECLSNPYLKSVRDGGERLDFSPTLHKMRRYKSVCHGDFMQRRKASEEESEAGVSVQDVHRNSCCWQYQSLFARICREHDKSYTKALVSNHIFFCPLRPGQFAVSRVSILGSTSLAVNRRRGAEGARSPGVAAIR